MGKDLFLIALGGKGTKRLIALFVFAVLFAAGQGFLQLDRLDRHVSRWSLPFSVPFFQGMAP